MAVIVFPTYPTGGSTKPQLWNLCDTTADRDAITGQTQGDESYCKDTKETYSYNGTAWATETLGPLSQAYVLTRTLGA